MMANEKSWRSEADIRGGLLDIWQVMQDCVARGCATDGVLPGGLKVRRRAAELHRTLSGEHFAIDPLRVMDWVTLFALAVNEENAAGGRVVTAPTNGAAGIIPAVLHYYTRFVPGASPDGVVRFLLTAAAVGVLFKENASISGAEVGCQGEVGSACSMAAAGPDRGARWHAQPGGERRRDRDGTQPRPDLRSGRRPRADPVHRAQRGRQRQGDHRAAGSRCAATAPTTSRSTRSSRRCARPGADMKVKYKETARGGLAVNVIEC